jgi:hypothetical protein
MPTEGRDNAGNIIISGMSMGFTCLFQAESFLVDFLAHYFCLNCSYIYALCFSSYRFYAQFRDLNNT